MQVVRLIGCLLAVFVSTALFSGLARYIMHIMIDPPVYYEGRDWFDQPQRFVYDHITVEIVDRNEEDFK